VGSGRSRAGDRLATSVGVDPSIERAAQRWRELAEEPIVAPDAPGRFDGKVALVTGGSSGIGRAFCRRFAAEGAAVAILDVDVERARELAELLPKARAFGADVSDRVQVERSVAAAADTLGVVDILVNCAGGALRPPRRFWETPEEDWDLVIGVNLKSQWLVARAVVPGMLATGRGKIVNVASMASTMGAPGLAAYASAKAGVVALTRAMARELGPHRINVNAVSPAFTLNERVKATYGTNGDAQLAAAERYLGLQALPHIGTPPDIAAVGIFLASEEADHVTGAVVPVDGGLVYIPDRERAPE